MKETNNFIVDRKKILYDKKDDNLFKITRYCRKCKKNLPISHYFTDQALICKECQLARITKIKNFEPVTKEIQSQA